MKKIYKGLQTLFIMAFIMTPFMLTGQSNQYLHFDGEDDFAILNQAGQYVDGATALSITGWFYCD